MREIVKYAVLWLISRLVVILGILVAVDYVGIHPSKGIVRCFLAWFIIWGALEVFHWAESKLEDKLKKLWRGR